MLHRRPSPLSILLPLGVAAPTALAGPPPGGYMFVDRTPPIGSTDAFAESAAGRRQVGGVRGSSTGNSGRSATTGTGHALLWADSAASVAQRRIRGCCARKPCKSPVRRKLQAIPSRIPGTC